MSNYTIDFRQLNQTFYKQVAAGLVPGHEIITKFATNEDLDTAAHEEIWHTNNGTANQTAQINPILTPTTFTLKSTSVNDDIAGTGMRKVEVSYIDANFMLASEIVDMAGTGAAVTTGTGYAIWRLKGYEAGTYGGGNNGNIRAYGTDQAGGDIATNIQAYIPEQGPTGKGSTLMSQFWVPTGKVAELLWLDVSFAADKTVNVDFQIQENANVFTPGGNPPMSPWRTIWHNHNSDVVNPPSPLIIPSNTKIRAIGIASGIKTEVSVNYQLMLKPV